MRRQLHEIKMQKGDSVMYYFLKFDEICMSMQAIGDEIVQDERIVILPESLSEEYDQIVKIIENMKGMDLFQAKEMLRREYEGIARMEKSEIALKATRRFKSKSFQSKESRNKFTGTCFICGKHGHKKQDCWKNSDKKKSSEQAFTVGEQCSDGWLLDSGASSHMCPFQDDFAEIRPLNESVGVSIAIGQTIMADGVGKIRVLLKKKKLIRNEDLSYVPDPDLRLLSIPALSAKGLHATFRNKTCEIRNDQKLVTQVTQMGKLFVIEYDTIESASVSKEVGGGAKPVGPSMLHTRLGLLPMKAIKNLGKCVEGLTMEDSSVMDVDQDEISEVCVTERLSVKPFPKSTYGEVKTTSLIQVIHGDVLGPIKTKSQGGARFVVTFLDDCSGYVVAYYIPHKSNVVDKFIKYKSMMENQLNNKIKCIRTDNGGEYINNRFTENCRKAGIVHQATVPYSPQQNGIAERLNLTLNERARSFFNYMQVEKKWWAEAIITAVFVTNRFT
uniref:Polyprotein n=1 Tax=Peronospora matthiolae TaxID=2874970 RepID=A0AAV1V209_9STRA